MWENTGHEPTVSLFYGEEPNNYEGDEDCVQTGYRIYWWDTTCSKSMSFICESAILGCDRR